MPANAAPGHDPADAKGLSDRSWGADRLAVVLLCGTESVRQRCRELAEWLGDSPQRAELEELRQFLGRPTRIPVKPWLGLVYKVGGEAGARGTLVGAVFVVEFGSVFAPWRIVASDNPQGRRTVFGAPEQRVLFAALVGRSLLEAGASLVSIDVKVGESVPDLRMDLACLAPGLRGQGLEWAVLDGNRAAGLALEATVEATLAKFGGDTRRNLKRYRQRCVQELGARFEVPVYVPMEEMLRLNRDSAGRVSERLVRWRMHLLERSPEAFVAGVADGRGVYLSVAGGRVVAGEMHIDWITHRRGFERYSMGTVLRSFLIEHGVRSGAKLLSFEGGNRHAMSGAFVQQPVYNVAMRRRTGGLWLLEAVLRRLWPRKAITKAVHRRRRDWHLFSASDGNST